MNPIYTDENIRWIKQYREENKCGLQEAKKVLLLNRIYSRVSIIQDNEMKALFTDILELLK